MKSEIAIGDRGMNCDICGRDRQCVKIYRNAKRGERENFLVYVCRSCADIIIFEFDKSTEPTRPSSGFLATSNALLKRYVEMVNSGDCGNWDPEAEPEVIAMRKAITKATT